MKLNMLTLNSNLNFGDRVNKIFWEKLADKTIYFDSNENHFVTTGSILCLVNNKSHVFGTGFISEYGDMGGGQFESHLSRLICKPHLISAVRGPLTRDKILGFDIDCPEIYGDPLMLMPCLYEPCDVNKTELQKTVGIIPHYVDSNSDNLKQLSRALELNHLKVKHIDIRVGENYKQLINQISSCEYIISSSLHGVIMGIMYHKKTIFMEFSDLVLGDGFKFQDFFESIGVKYSNTNIYKEDCLNNIIHVDYDKVSQTTLSLISAIPFCSHTQKQQLINKFIKFHNANIPQT